MGGFLSLGEGYDPAAEAHFARMASAGSAPDEARRKALNDLIVALKAPAGSDPSVWSRGYHLTVAGASEAVSNLNLFGATFDLTKVGTVAFVADRGWTPSFGVGHGLNSHFNPSLHGLQDDASLGVFMRGTLNGSTSGDAGCDDGTYFHELYTWETSSDQTAVALNKAVGAAPRFGPTLTTLSKAFTIASRSVGSSVVAYRDGAGLGGGSSASAGRPNAEVHFGGIKQASGLTGSSVQWSAFWIGKGITTAQAAAFNTALRAYLTAVGALP